MLSAFAFVFAAVVSVFAVVLWLDRREDRATIIALAERNNRQYGALAKVDRATRLFHSNRLTPAAYGRQVDAALREGFEIES